MHLFDFAYCGAFPSQLQSLANISPEKWSFGNNNDNSILRNYVMHTFERLYDEGKVVETEDYAIFNTGLFDVYYNPIYAYFVKNSNQNKQKWYLDNFITEYQRVTMGISQVPERANYFTNPADLVFDTHLNIIAQYEHIFGDTENRERLPIAIRNSSMAYSLFNGAVATARKMLEANYKTAVPQFYKGKIQLLVPICLQNQNIPDLALTCAKADDGKSYLGCTCLTLEMAYNNARLIAKPDSNWLHA